MNQTSPSQHHHYFVALVMPASFNEKVQVFKQWMKDRFGCTVALRSPAHITIIPPFWASEEREADLIRTLDKLSSPQFTIMVNGFSRFGNRTIFLQPDLPDSLRQLKTEAERLFLQLSIPGIKKEERSFHPHITIATRDLEPKDFAEAWKHFEQKEWKATWEVDSISLLRHNKKSWDVYYTSQLQK